MWRDRALCCRIPHIFKSISPLHQQFLGVEADELDVSNGRVDLVEGVGAPPAIYSLEVNGWAINAASFIMSRQQEAPSIVYISTTDYAMHTYAPDEPQSQEHMTILDEAIGELVDSHPDITLLLTADHGMSAKSRMVDLKSALEKYGIKARAVPIIKDRYVVHHSNLGGCIFVYQTYSTRPVLRNGKRHSTPRAIKTLLQRAKFFRCWS